MMNAYTTHASVRVKGTENNYEPSPCVSPSCPHKLTPHMHCPFCVKTDFYMDPVILKAHYRVKHVDKGIDFAGLKVLRCCDHCDIVGTIKGIKEFKGAHWHCYKCRNGFNRRDEAIKHYRTHFRNPQTTFQIQISREVNQMPNLEAEQAANTVTQTAISMVPQSPLADSVITTAPPDTGIINVEPGNTITNGKVGDGEVHVSIAANETVGGETETILIINDASQVGSSLDTTGAPIQSYQIQNIMQESVEVESGDEVVPIAAADHMTELQQQVEELRQEKIQLQDQLQEEIHHLRVQVQMQAEEIASYQKREQELLNQLSIPLDERIQELLSQLKSDHEDLLHQQLAVLRRTYLQQFVSTENRNTIEMQTEIANKVFKVQKEQEQAGEDVEVTDSKASISKCATHSILILEDTSQNTHSSDEEQHDVVNQINPPEGTADMIASNDTNTGPTNSDITIHVLQMSHGDDSITNDTVSLEEVVSKDTSLTVQAAPSPVFPQEEISERTSPPPEKKSRTDH